MSIISTEWLVSSGRAWTWKRKSGLKLQGDVFINISPAFLCQSSSVLVLLSSWIFHLITVYSVWASIMFQPVSQLWLISRHPDYMRHTKLFFMISELDWKGGRPFLLLTPTHLVSKWNIFQFRIMLDVFFLNCLLSSWIFCTFHSVWTSYHVPASQSALIDIKTSRLYEAHQIIFHD